MSRISRTFVGRLVICSTHTLYMYLAFSACTIYGYSAACAVPD